MANLDKHTELWREASKRLGDVVSVCEEERELALRDRRFVTIAGAMWEGAAISAQYGSRVRMEIPKVKLAVNRIEKDYRGNRFEAKFTSRDGTAPDEFTDFLSGLYRADRADSNAQEALDLAFRDAIKGGFGAYRLSVDVDGFGPNQKERIAWRPIVDADTSVFFDLNAIRQDKSDARFCFVLTGMTPEQFEAEYGEDPASFQKPITDGEFDWGTPNYVYVAEYFVVEEKDVEYTYFTTIAGGIEVYPSDSLTIERSMKLESIGSKPTAKQTFSVPCVKKYTLSGAGVIGEPEEIPGGKIPVVPVYGHYDVVDGVERFHGHVRPLVDVQTLYNMQASQVAEDAVSGGQRVPVFLPEQVSGHEKSWADQSVDRPAFLLLNAIENADGQTMPTGPIGYTEPPAPTQAQASLIEMANRDMQDLTGRQEAGEEIVPGASGRALELMQTRLDAQSYGYMSNFAKSERRAAEIYLGMAADIYDGQSQYKTMDERGAIDFPDMSAVHMVNGTPRPLYDFAHAEYDVAIEIGPTSASKRQATVSALGDMLPNVADPQDQVVLTSMIMMNMEGEGIGPVRDYFRKKLVDMGVIEPTEREMLEQQQAQAQQQPSAQDQYLMAEAEKARAQAMESQADAAEAVANAEYKKAQTAKTLAEIDTAARESVVQTVDQLSNAGPAPLLPGARTGT